MVKGDFANAVGGWEKSLLEGRYYFFGFMLVAGSNVDGAIATGEEIGGFYADTGGGTISGGGILASGACDRGMGC